MDDEMTQSNPNEEATPTQIPAVSGPVADDMPTTAITPLEATEATQTMLTEATVDEMATVTITPNVPTATPQTAPVADLAEILPTTPQPMQTYEQFGMLTEPAQMTPYPGIVAQPPQANNQAQFTQNASVPLYADYTANASYALQPSQPFSAQPTAQAATPSKRSPLLWMLLIALVAFLLGGGSVFAYQALALAQIPSPNGTLHKFCDGVNTANAQEIYDTLSQQAKTHTSLDDIQRVFDAFNFLNASSNGTSIKFGNCTTSNLRVSGPLAVATVTLSLDMTLQGQTTSIGTPSLVSLVLENQQWKIDFSSLTQPLPSLTAPNLFPTPTPSSN